MTAAVETVALSKRFGPVQALVDLSLEVLSGEVFGFLGPNGAGKTTTTRLLLDLLRPTSGTARVLGMDVRRDGVAVRRRTGYLPADLALDRRLTGGELFDYYANLRGGVDRRWRDELVERLALDPSRRLHTLSGGNRKKVGIVQAFMHRPDVVVLDEPTTGLDPIVQRTFLNLVRDVAAEGGCVFLSSHVLAEVEDVADRVGILREGRLVTVDTLAALTRRAVRRLRFRFAERVPAGAFQALEGVTKVRVEGRVVDVTVTGSPDALLKAAAGFRVEDVSLHDTDLEDVFLEYYRGRPRC